MALPRELQRLMDNLRSKTSITEGQAALLKELQVIDKSLSSHTIVSAMESFKGDMRYTQVTAPGSGCNCCGRSF